MRTQTIVRATADETIWIYWTLPDGTVLQRECLRPPDAVIRQPVPAAVVVDVSGQGYPRMD